MSVYFAAARSCSASPVARALAPRSLPVPANDETPRSLLGDPILREALLYFAEHGLGAAQFAHGAACRAYTAGDRPAQRRWTAICRMLDNRLADDLTSRTSAF